MAAAVGLAVLGINLLVAEHQRAELLTSQLTNAQAHVYSSGIVLADQALEKHDSQGLSRYLDNLRPKAAEADRRGFEWYYLWRQNNLARLTLPTLTFSSDNYDLMDSTLVDGLSNRRRLVFSPDGKLIATRKNLCDVTTGKQVHSFDSCDRVFFSADGRFFNAGDVVFDLVSHSHAKLPLAPRQKGRNEGEYTIFPARSQPLGFLRDPNALVVLHTGEKKQRSGFRGTASESAASVKSYEAATGKETVHEFQVRKGHRILAAALCEATGQLAVATAQPMDSSIWEQKDEVELWNLASGERKFFQFEKFDEQSPWGNADLLDLQFSPDGGTLGVITRDNVVRLCDPTTGQMRVNLGRIWPRYWTFSADGKTLVALPRNGTLLHVWDVATGKLLANPDLGMAGYADSLGAQPEVAVSSNGKVYAAGGGTKVIQIRDTLTGAVRTTLLGHKHPVRDLTFSHDGQSLATLDLEQRWPESESTAMLWDAAEETPISLPLDTSAVTALGRSSDGRTVAIGFADGTIRLCHADSLQVLKTLRRKSTKVDVLRFSEGDKQLAASHSGPESEENIDVWNVDREEVIASFPGYLKAFEGGIVAAVASLGEPRSFPEPPNPITLWKVVTKQRVAEIKDAHRKLFAMTRDGQLAATAVFDPQGNAGQCRFKVWTVADGKAYLPGPEAFVGHGNSPSWLRFSADGTYLAVADDFLSGPPDKDQNPTFRSAGRLYDTAMGQERFVFPLAMQNRNAVSEPEDQWTLAEFSPDNKLLVAISNGPDSAFRSNVSLWDVAAGKELAILPNPENFACVYAAFSPDGKSLATMTFGEWKRTYTPAVGPNAQGDWAGTWDIRMGRADANSSGMSGGTGGLTTISPVYEIHLWDVATRQRRNRFIVSWHDRVEQMSFSADGHSILTITSSYESGLWTPHRLQMWDVKTGKERGSLGDHGARFHALAYAADGRLLALTDQRLNLRLPEQYPSSYKIRMWDVLGKKELAAPQLFTATQMPLDLSPDSLAVMSNAAPEPDAWNNEFHAGANSVAATSPNGKLKAIRGYRPPTHSNGRDGDVKVDASPADITVISTATSEVLHVLRSYGETPSRLTFSPDGKTLAIGQTSGNIQLWNVVSGRLLKILSGQSGPVSGLAFRADGRCLASCSDKEIRLWPTATDDEVAPRDP
jgi:WD40 repeat protein